ncbi:YqjK family protein [Halomonas sp. I5-271120]|uniref:YqjK family protein n=1 Tax=Halomonas sp. I5-271120 TaxID=3061632 RepID=UPI002714D939|nr:YqjK family protein [Halomonas sp. I5-271120]
MPTPTTNAVARKSTDTASLAARKALLEARIEQQRIDVLVNAEHWRHATQGIDAFYHAVLRWKAPLYGIAGIIAWRSLRRPKGVRRLAGRAFGLAMTARRLRRIIK